MRLTTNDKLIERQSKIARYCTFGGLGILLASLVTSFTNNFPIVVAYALLILGFGLAYVGSILANKWIKEPRADTALARALKGFDNKFHLYNYLLPVNHVLLGPNGVTVLRVKSNDGKITCRSDKWKGSMRWSRLFGGMGQEALGNPTIDVNEDIAKIKKLLADHMADVALVPIDGYIVFTDPKADIAIEECSYPVVRVDDLKETIRKNKRGAPMTPALLQQVGQALDDEANAKTA